jgi:putative transposase
MKLQRVERHIIVKNKRLDELTYLSKNLYNYANYCMRQSFIKTGKLPKEYDLTTKWNAKHRGQADFLTMPTSHTAKQAIKLLFKNWKSFFKASKEYKKNPSKFKARPKMPKYKHKTKGRNIIIFTAQNVKVKDGYVHFSKKAGIDPIKTKVTSHIRQVRIIPQATCFICEVVYEIEKKQVDLVNDTWLSIDLGLNNLVTTFNNIGEKPFIINGKVIKSINQYYNKQKAKLMSFIGNTGYSNRINKLTHKRNMKINDYFHKTSRFIVDYCIEHKIEKIIIGDNKDWKQSINIGKRNNQNFVSIPHAKLIQQIQYKAEEVGIEFVLTEESYTSKTDHFALEPLKKHLEKGDDGTPRPTLGKRVKRGLFRSSTNRLINADVNGAIGIARKVVCESPITELLANRGVATTPSIVRYL